MKKIVKVTVRFRNRTNTATVEAIRKPNGKYCVPVKVLNEMASAIGWKENMAYRVENV